jgi:pyrimidine operon attenuation protein/uracil phosphoribosyltransferase
MKPVEEESLVLDAHQIKQKISRIAFEIYENNYKEKELVVAGIQGSGYTLAGLLNEELKRISPFKLSLVRIDLDKSDPHRGEVALDFEVQKLKNKVIILVDDVLSTGRTFLHSMKPFLNVEVKKIETVVLINRSHKLFPISADYKGYELSTTLNDHIQVVLEKGKFGVYLY